jgi:hypothetical protein
VKALADEKVGRYLNTHFVSSYQKVGTFRIANGQKQGGNVASYFCTPKGQVLHVLAGPVGPEVFLREARWVIETHKLAVLEKRHRRHDLQEFFRRAHAVRLKYEFGVANISPGPGTKSGSSTDPAALLAEPRYRHLSRQGLVHLLLAAPGSWDIQQLYRVVFERILGEKISTLPVARASAPITRR